MYFRAILRKLKRLNDNATFLPIFYHRNLWPVLKNKESAWRRRLVHSNVCWTSSFHTKGVSVNDVSQSLQSILNLIIDFRTLKLSKSRFHQHYTPALRLLKVRSQIVVAFFSVRKSWVKILVVFTCRDGHTFIGGQMLMQMSWI